jgi:hypothetical protein
MMLEITLHDSNFSHQEYVSPYLESNKVTWKRDNIRRKINVYTDNFIKKSIINIPNDGNKNICLLLEPLTNPPWTDVYDYIRTDFEKFDLIITHNLYSLKDLIDSQPYKFMYSSLCCSATWLRSEDINIPVKNKNISMLFSDKNFSEGHQIRHHIYNKYKDTKTIDFFGVGAGAPLINKIDAIKDYKYSISCENSLQEGYNSEKLNDLLLTGTIPIYWGAKTSNTEHDLDGIFYFSPQGINSVNFDFAESLKKLDKIIENITEYDPYYKLTDGINNNYIYANKIKQSENTLYSILESRNYI